MTSGKKNLIIYCLKQKSYTRNIAKKKKIQTPIGPKARRTHQLLNKTASFALPATMKHPDDPSSKLVTWQLVNELWGKSPSATRPNTMPKVSTEPGRPSWLDPSLRTDIRGRIAPFENELMAPISETEFRTFLHTKKKSCPGVDRIQYDVLRFMCFDATMQDLGLHHVVLRFCKLLIHLRKMPTSMKQALLTFIYKFGDPLVYKNYRGISLLSCLFKLITGTLNGRLQNILHTYSGLDTNQGANHKGIHASHKAAVIMNIFADARLHKKELHIIYTDINGAFPSVPYQAFTDALHCL
jgi:hypothetical protein